MIRSTSVAWAAVWHAIAATVALDATALAQCEPGQSACFETPTTGYCCNAGFRTCCIASRSCCADHATCTADGRCVRSDPGPGPDDPGPMSICDDSCEYANDDVCDDGTAGALYDACEYGTDCSDCGPRPAAGQPGPGGCATAAAIGTMPASTELACGILLTMLLRRTRRTARVSGLEPSRATQ